MISELSVNQQSEDQMIYCQPWKDLWLKPCKYEQKNLIGSYMLRKENPTIIWCRFIISQINKHIVVWKCRLSCGATVLDADQP